QPGADAFLAKLNPVGAALSYSTYIGGNSADAANGVAADSAGNAFVVGDTQSSDFVTALAAPVSNDNTLGGTQDAFVLKANTRVAGAASLVYATFLGGSGTDGAQAVAIDSAGEAFVTGSTASTDFPVFNPFDNTLGGTRDAYVTKLNAAGTALVYSTFL